MSLVDATIAEAASLTGDLCGRLFVGASSTPGTYLLPLSLVRLRTEYPLAEVIVESGNSQAIERRLYEHQIDLGLMGRPPTRSDLQSEVIVADDIVFVTSPRHRLAGKQQVSAKALMEEALLVREYGSATRSVLAAALIELGLRLKPLMEMENTEAIKRSVMAGLGRVVW